MALNMSVGQTSFFDLLKADRSTGALQGSAPTDTVVDWTSSDEAVATVEVVSYGDPSKSTTACAKVTAVGAGTATITGNVSGITDTLDVVVSGTDLHAVKISPSKPS